MAAFPAFAGLDGQFGIPVHQGVGALGRPCVHGELFHVHDKRIAWLPDGCVPTQGIEAGTVLKIKQM